MSDSTLSLQDPSEEPEQDGLLRLTRLVESLFHVPVAYMAMLDSDLAVVSRIGSGSEHWEDLKTFPRDLLLAKPNVWKSGTDVPGFNPGSVKFAASAPLRSSEGVDLGLLVIADTQPRPEFSQKDMEALAELAGVLAGKMELRLMVCQARATELALREAERRFRNIANAAPVLIIYSGADGASSFVNKTWLEFTGRSLVDELGDGYADTFHPDDRETVVQKYWDAFTSRTPHTQEFSMLRHDGEYRRMLVQGVPRFEDDGTFEGYIGCLVDVTDQRSRVPAR